MATSILQGLWQINHADLTLLNEQLASLEKKAWQARDALAEAEQAQAAISTVPTSVLTDTGTGMGARATLTPTTPVVMTEAMIQQLLSWLTAARRSAG